jgi:hypothetical protein
MEFADEERQEAKWTVQNWAEVEILLLILLRNVHGKGSHHLWGYIIDC